MGKEPFEQIVWNDFLNVVREEAGNQVVETWFKSVTLQQWNSFARCAILKVPNEFVKTWLQEHYIELIQKHLARLVNVSNLRIVFLCKQQEKQTPRTIIPAASLCKAIPISQADPEKIETQEVGSIECDVAVQTSPSTALVTTSQTQQAKKDRRQGLNPHYVFSSFVVGPTNSLAHAAAQAVSKQLGGAYNPLFIYGGTGLGKTHLLHAIGNEVMQKDATLCVRYETADKFINDFINAIRFDRADQFRSKYKKVDLLLLDDIQFFSNKEQTQEAFFHVFNLLYEQQKQIVMSSDMFPQEIKGLQGRLRSRMGCGLVADIQLPDLETKIAILKKKAAAHAIDLHDDVAEFIASHVVSNIRELEGALIRVSAFGSLIKESLSISLAKRVLVNVTKKKREGILLERVLKLVANHFNTSILDMRSKKRHKDLAKVRQIAFYLMKKVTDHPLQVIGKFVGGRDHSTVVHAINKVESFLKSDQELAQRIRALEQELEHE